MKKRILAFALTLLLLCPLLCSCFTDEEGNFVGLSNFITFFSQSPADIIEDVLKNPLDVFGDAEEPLYEENEPYGLEFLSHGDGTCSVTKIEININYTEPFDLVIPCESPDGDTVTTVEWGANAFQSAYNCVPKYMTTETFSHFIKSIENNVSEFELKKVHAYFSLQDPNNSVNAEITSQMNKNFPLTKYFPVYVLDSACSASEAVFIGQLIAKYVSPTLVYEEYLNITGKVKSMGGNLADVNIPPVSLTYNSTLFINSLQLPNSVEYVDSNCFNGFYASSNILLPANTSASVIRALMLSDVYVCMDTEEVHDEWRDIYESQRAQYMQYGIMDYKLLIYSENAPEEVNVGDISASALIPGYWGYVDGVPTPWFNR